MSSELPQGTVTFLFTDVEGSTRLLEELGAERYAQALGEHRGIVRAALDRHAGVEVDTQGDAFFCAFASGRAAVTCAGEIQQALAPGPIRVRIGIHTGEALVADDHYVGMDVHRAARIGACGHGGQVVISPTTVSVLGAHEFVLRDLGVHRLKDLAEPAVLYQLGVDDFPPLKTLFRTNLPVPATPFLGREAELEDLVTLVSERQPRLLTLTGPGGTGKTRLALQLAAELSTSFPDGTRWVPLASLRDGALVASAVAGAHDVDEEPGRPLVQSITDALASKRALIVLDNCEHLVEAAAGLAAAIVAACPSVLVLATSREGLAIAGEHVFPVLSLVERDAVELFYARARSAGATLGETENDVVTELCRRLDNLPLAVELAAARASALPPAALLERLSSGLDVLKGPRDAEDRQRTLHATIAWSHGLLDDAEQRLFRRLGVFVGGASLTAIEEVCEADLEELLSLVAKSLVRQLQAEGGSEPRYWMLETIREFAVEELAASGELSSLQSRHLDVYAGAAIEAAEGLQGVESGAWLVRFEHDLANMRSAFSYAAGSGRRDEAATVALALALRHFFRGRYSEADEVVRQAIALAPAPLELGVLQNRLASLLRMLGDPDAALDAYDAAEQTFGGIADRDDRWWRRWLDLQLGRATFYYFENRQQELAELVARIEPLVVERGDPEQKLELMHLRTQQAYREERYAPSEATERLARETYRTALEVGGADADFLLGFCLLWRGKLEEAEKYFVRGREAAQKRGIAVIDTRCLVYGTIARRRRNDVEGAREWVAELDAQEELHGYRGLTAANAAWIACRDGDHELALERGGEALADWHSGGRSGSPFEWTVGFPLLEVALARGDIEDALEHARAMLDESLQPLPDELASALGEAVESGSSALLERALQLARPIGYA